MATTKTYCRHCMSLCGLEVEVAENKVLSVKGDRANPLSQGYSCMMGQHNIWVQDTPERLVSGRKRRTDGSFEDIDALVALGEIGNRLKDIHHRWGPRSIALYYGTGTAYGGLAYSMARTWLRAIGSPELYTSMTVDQSAKWVCRSRMGVFATGKPLYTELDVMMLVGNNPVVSHQGFGALDCANPLKQLSEARQRGVKTIVIDPRRTETAQRADIHLQVMPGQDATLFAALIREILANGWEDKPFCSRFTTSIDRLREAVIPFDLQYAAARCGVPAEQIAQAARIFGTAKRRSVTTGTGTNMAHHSNLNEHFAEALNAICGGYRRAGDPLHTTGGLFNLTSTTERVVPPSRSWECAPKLRSVDSGQLMGEFPTSRLPDEILHTGEDRIRALISFGGSPATSIGGTTKTINSLKSLELLVSVDPRMSETGRYAHYIIPTKLPFERMDMTTLQDMWFSRNFVNFTEPVVTPPPGVLEDWEVFYGLARHMGVQLNFRVSPVGMTLPHTTPLDMENKPTTEDLFRLSCQSGRVPFDVMKAHPGGLLLPSNDVVRAASQDDGARLDLCPEDVFVEIRQLRAEDFRRDVRFPYDLISRRIKRVVNTAYHKLPSVRKQHLWAPLAMHPEDIAAAEMQDGELVSISSSAGKITGRLTADETLRRGVVSMPMGWGSSDPEDYDSSLTSNLVSIDENVEPINFMPRFSGIPVNVVTYK
jgi:anaerobic selenocysteine-containing dehydrogenase